jgi:hypothetical protein
MGMSDHAINCSTPLYCDVCQKQFAKEIGHNAHLNGNKYKKNAERAKAEANGAKENGEPTLGKMSREQRQKEISYHEYMITKLCQGDRLMAVISATIERQSVLSDRERQVESLHPPYFLERIDRQMCTEKPPVIGR